GGFLQAMEKADGKMKWMGFFDRLNFAMKSALNPWSALDNFIALGEETSHAAIPKSAASADTQGDKVARIKRMEEQFAAAKKFYNERVKSETELADIQGSGAEKVARLKREIADTESRMAKDEFEGLENDKKRAELAGKQVELAKAEAALNKANLDLEKQ